MRKRHGPFLLSSCHNGNNSHPINKESGRSCALRPCYTVGTGDSSVRGNWSSAVPSAATCMMLVSRQLARNPPLRSESESR